MTFSRVCIRMLPFAGLTALLLLAGCGASEGSLSGKVTHKGAALKGGTILFVSTSSKPSASTDIADDGSYSVPSLRTGTYKVVVETESLKLKAPSGPMYGSGYGGMGKGQKGGPPGGKNDAPKGMNVPEGYKMSMPTDNSKRYVKIPEKYADQGQTPLTVEVTGGAQKYDITVD